MVIDFEKINEIIFFVLMGEPVVFNNMIIHEYNLVEFLNSHFDT
ncbi:hypothetical protein [Methanobrevibacter sp.]